MVATGVALLEGSCSGSCDPCNPLLLRYWLFVPERKLLLTYSFSKVFGLVQVCREYCRLMNTAEDPGSSQSDGSSWRVSAVLAAKQIALADQLEWATKLNRLSDREGPRFLIPLDKGQSRAACCSLPPRGRSSNWKLKQDSCNLTPFIQMAEGTKL